MRIYELSKKISVANKEIIAKLAGMGIEVKSHMANIDDDIAEKLTSIFLKPEKPKAEGKPVTPGKEPITAKPAVIKETPETVKPVEKTAARKTKDVAVKELQPEKAVAKPSAEEKIKKLNNPLKKSLSYCPKVWKPR